MDGSRQLFIFITLTLWGTLLGGILYSHLVFFPPYLSHLPESTALLNGPYGIDDARFWMMIHPLLILSVLITLILNWKLAVRRKYLLIAAAIYGLAIISTFLYFVPELKTFADSSHSSVSASEWFQRGQRWQYLSWIRGAFMYAGFVMILIALTKNRMVKVVQ